MKLSPAFVIQQLSNTYEIVSTGELSNQPCLDKLYFYPTEASLIENTLYLLDDSFPEAKIDSIPQNSLAVLIQNKRETPRILPANLCLLKGASSILSLFNQIQELFQTFDCWQKTLMSACLNGEPVQKLLDISYPVLKMPLAIVDSNYHLIASTPACKQDSIPHYLVPKQDGCISGPGFFCVYIKSHSYASHRLFMLNKEPNTSCEYYGFLLEYLAEMAQYAFTHNTILHSLFQTILTDKSADYATISRQLDTLGWRAESHYLCIILENKTLDLHPICSYLENSMPCACAFIYKNNIVLYINQTKSQLDISAISEKLAYLIRDRLLKAGYSRCLPGHQNLYEQYIQAYTALETGKRIHPNLWIHHFDEIALDYILEEATKKLPAYMISHEKLLKLKNIDDLHHTEYVKTLRYYLDNHCNAVQTAKALYIHRSTFLYRLDKIKNILRTDLNNPDEVLYLMLSFRFIEMKEKNKPYALTSTLS